MQATSPQIRAEPNVTPMIDVMLVLLIIFMAVGPMLVDGFHAKPPTGTHLAAHPDEPEDVVIGLDADGRYYFNKQPVTEAQLAALLADNFRSGDRVAYLRADRELAYSRVNAAMDLIATGGAQVVGLVSVQPVAATSHRLSP